MVFKGWTRGSKRDFDFELMDPGEPRDSDEDSAIREILGYYADRYSESAGLVGAAERLRELAKLVDLYDRVAVEQLLGSPHSPERIFSRSSITLNAGDEQRMYWGSFWRTDMVPHPTVKVGDKRSADFPDAYVGIDSRIIQLARERRFAAILDLEWQPASYSFWNEYEEQCGIAVALADGSLFAWCDESTTPLTVNVLEAK